MNGNKSAGHAASFRRLGAAIAASVSLLGLPLPASAQAPADTQVRTEAGSLRGAVADGMVQYLGIPYAAPPVGELRWEAPQSPGRWDSIRDATKFASNCAQTVAVGEFSAPSDTRCLYLNVFVPSAPAAGGKENNSKLPVMFWIPGGGLFAGGGSHYDPKSLVANGHVIVVTMNSRVGLPGFFAHPGLGSGGDKPAGAAVNFGFLDQQFALRWVRRNIAAFGGDPGNVTLFGESAGAVSIMATWWRRNRRACFTRRFWKAV